VQRGEEGRELDEKKEKKEKANFGKLVDDTVKSRCGGDVSVVPRTVLAVI
jgi:hypothetical protein